MSLRIAIYARYSDHKQNPMSINDQIKLCDEAIKKQFPEANIIIKEADPEKGGGLFLKRKGIQKILKHAENKHFDLLVAESLDRISRSMKDISLIYEHLSYYDIDMWTVNEQKIGKLEIGFKGTMNSLHLDGIKKQVKRGLIARASEGRTPAGVCYGYKVVAKITDDGRIERGHREIIPKKAKIIKRIFNNFANGMTIKAICRILNNENIPSPNGKTWRPVSIAGAVERQEGVLNKSIYNGWLIYNRSKKVIHPVTEKVRTVARPEHEWVKTYCPELKIIDDDLWNKVKARQRQRVGVAISYLRFI